jgi:predicted permease
MRRGMGTLVAGEVALATLLLVVSALAVTDIRLIGHTEAGFRTDGVVTFRVAPDPRTYPKPEDRLAFWERYRDTLGALPGVENVAIATVLPLMGHSGWFFDVEGSRIEADKNAVVLRRWVEPGYFDALDVRLVLGRGFDEFDGRASDTFVAVVNASFVRSHLAPNVSPIGQRIRTGSQAPWETIVGVTADTKHYGLDRDSRPSVYEPWRQNPGLSGQVALVSSGDLAGVVATARRATQDVDAELPLYDVQTMAERVDRGLLTRRASSWMIAIFSAVALILAIAGLYGVISYGVGQRAHEIGIRMALGAQRSAVQALVIRQGLVIVLAGLALGLSGAVALTRVTSSVLIAAGSHSLPVFAGVGGLVLAVALLANWSPARRAARFDPMTLLRRG